MQRPPLFLTRPTMDWINRVGQKHNQWQALHLSAKQHQSITAWVETEFVTASLTLDGQAVTREQVKAVSAADDEERQRAEPAPLIGEQREALRLAQTQASSPSADELITPGLLLKLHRPLANTARFRTQPITAAYNLQPPLPEHLAARLQSACFWFTAESFLELNPIEQAAIVYLRLMELQPFDDGNTRTACVAASLFTLRQSLPPLIIQPDQQAPYREALEESRQSNTKPMVELLARATEQTLDAMIEMIRSNP